MKIEALVKYVGAGVALVSFLITLAVAYGDVRAWRQRTDERMARIEEEYRGNLGARLTEAEADIQAIDRRTLWIEFKLQSTAAEGPRAIDAGAEER